MNPDTFRPRLLDPVTTALLVLMLGGQYSLFLAVAGGSIGMVPAAVIGTLLMNLSFTLWHECAHGLFSSRRWINDLVGATVAVFSVGPPYFFRRNEHLIHHRWQGDPENDPVFPRIQTSWWRFPFRLFYLRFRPEGRVKFAELMPFSEREAALDNLQRLILFTGLAALALFVSWEAVLAVFVLPRLGIFLLHAYYICYLPHHDDKTGYTLQRNLHLTPVYTFFSVFQDYHATHHARPHLPWYLYPFVEFHAEEHKHG